MRGLIQGPCVAGWGRIDRIEGPQFFGSTDGFAELFDTANDPSLVIVDFLNSWVVDQSALWAIEALASKYEAQGKTLQLRHPSRKIIRPQSCAVKLICGNERSNTKRRPTRRNTMPSRLLKSSSGAASCITNGSC